MYEENDYGRSVAQESKDMGAKAKVNWLAVRTYYLAGHAVSECASKFQISTRQIERRKASEDWQQARKDNVAQASAQVSALASEELAQTLTDHISFADELMAIALAGREDLAVMPPGRSRIEARRAMIESAERAVKIAREVRGLKSGDSSSETEIDDRQFELVRRVIPAPHVATA